MSFRTDINWLRAIAVIAVVLFNLNPSYMPSGFAGVYVFFVISSFLMTKIIFSRIEFLKLPTYSWWGEIFKIKPLWLVLCFSLVGVCQPKGLLFLYDTTIKSIVDTKYDTNPRSKECFLLKLNTTSAKEGILLFSLEIVT